MFGLMKWQSKVTAVVKDSSDDLWFLESNSDDDLIGRVFANEFEPDNRYTVGGAGRSSDSEDDVVSSSQEVNSCVSSLVCFGSWLEVR